MQKETPLEAIDRRAYDARIPIYKLCIRAGIAPATVSRWRGEKASKPTARSLLKLENALTEIEQQRGPRNERR